MNKNLWLVITIVLFSLLGFFLFTNPMTPPEITFNGLKEGAKLPPKAPIVKGIQLDHLMPKDSSQEKIIGNLKKSKKEVEDRKSACEVNSKELFKKDDFYEEDIIEQLSKVFEKTLDRKASGKAFLEIQKLLKSDIPINLNIYYSLLLSLEICRPQNSMAFLDKIIESLKISGQDNNDLVRSLIANIKNNLLGEQYSPINLSLVFGKLGRLVNYKVIKDPYAQEIIELRKHFLSYEKELNQNLKKAEGSEQLRELTIEHFAELKEIAIELKSILEGI